MDSKKGQQQAAVLKLRGLPWNVTIDDIHTFLANITVPQGGVHLMNGANGRPSGLAYVELSSEEDQAEALRRDVCLGLQSASAHPAGLPAAPIQHARRRSPRS